MVPRAPAPTVPASLAGLLVCLASHAACTPAAAQSDGRFERFLERLDKDGNKSLDPDELGQIQGPFRGMLESSGVDLSRPISTNDLAERLRRRSEQFNAERGGDNGRSRDSDNGRSRDGDRGSDGGRDFGRFSREGMSREGFSRDGYSRDGSPGRSATFTPQPVSARPKSLVKRERTVPVLPTQYAAGDADRDGQLSLSEWKTWKGRAALPEFAQLDRDADGFLTPRELAPATTAPAAASTTPATPPATPAATATPAAPMAQAPKPGTPATPAAATTPAKPATDKPKVEADDPAAGFDDPSGSPHAPDDAPESTGEAADAARRFFDLLDQDRDGKVGPKEWNVSTRIRGLFAAARLDLTQPMPRKDFLTHYVKLSNAAR